MRIIYSARQSAREAVLSAELGQALRQGRPCALLVPEQYTLETERWLSHTLRDVPRLGLSIVSFNRLAHQLVDSKRGSRRKPLDRSGHLMALQRIVLGLREQLTAYGRVAGRTGFVSEAEGLLKELKLSGVAPQHLTACAEAAETPAQLGAKLKDLALIYGHYEAWVQEGHLDDTDRLLLLNQELQNRQPFTDTLIWFHGFRSFTPVEWQLIQTLYNQSARLSFSLGLPDPEGNQSVFRPLRRTLDRLVGMCEQGGAMSWISCDAESTGDANRLEDRLFGSGASPTGRSAVMLQANRCPTAFQEAEAAAAVLLEWAEAYGWHWRDMMVVMPSDPQWEEMLDRACRRQGIPLFADRKVPLSRHPLSHYLLDLVASARSGMNGETVCRALKWGYAGLSREQIEQLENHVLARGVRSHRWAASQFAPAGLEGVMDWVNEQLGALSRDLARIQDTGSRTARLKAFLEETAVPQMLSAEEEALLASGNLTEAQVQGQIWEKMQTVLEQITALLGHETVSLDEYQDILQAGLETVELGTIPPTLDQVSTGTLFRSRTSHMKGLLILGANEGQLPAYDSGDGLLLNDEKLLLAGQGIPLESDRDTRGSEEEYALYELLSKVEARLYVSCAQRDIGGERLQPSWFFEGLCAQGAHRIDEDQRPIPGDPAALISLLSDLKREGIPLKPWQAAAEARLAEHPRWREAVAAVSAGSRHRYRAEPLPRETVEVLMGRSLTLNATGLEQYTRCPFAWLVRHGLKPQPRKRFAITLPDMGTLFHMAVDRFMRVHGDQDWTGWSVEAVGTALEPVVEELARQYGYGVLEDTARTRFLKGKVSRLSQRALVTLGQHLQAGSFHVAGTELAFDMRPEREGLPPLVLETDQGQRLVVQGRIDRVDVCDLPSGAYGRIIDYKSGRPRFSLSDLAHGLELQLAVYLDVLNRHGEALHPGGIVPAGFLYFYLDDPLVDPEDDSDTGVERAIYRELRMEGLLVEEMEVLQAMDQSLGDVRQSAVIPVSLKQDGTPSALSSVISREAMTALLDYAENIIRQHGTAILAGAYEVQPCQTERGMACATCDYLALCQFDPGAEELPRRVLRKTNPAKALERIMGRAGHGNPMDGGTE